MKKTNRKPEIEVVHYGIYEHWEKRGKGVPKLKKITTEIPAELEIEFGMTIEINRGKGLKMSYQIDHPKFNDEFGQPAQSFTGDFHVNGNVFEFFLGDTIWAPIEEKCGEWRLRIWLDDEVVADKTLIVS